MNDYFYRYVKVKPVLHLVNDTVLGLMLHLVQFIGSEFFAPWQTDGLTGPATCHKQTPLFSAARMEIYFLCFAQTVQ